MYSMEPYEIQRQIHLIRDRLATIKAKIAKIKSKGTSESRSREDDQ